MKSFRLHVLSTLCFLFFSSVLHAQTCETVWGEITAPPQSGPYNYFGVRVSIAQAYYSNITVNGRIYEDGNGPSGGTPFSLTIYAGNLSAETESTFYRTGPASSAAFIIDYVSECPPTPAKAHAAIPLHTAFKDYLLRKGLTSYSKGELSNK